MALLLCQRPRGAPRSSRQWHTSCSCGPALTADNTAVDTSTCWWTQTTSRIGECYVWCSNDNNDDDDNNNSNVGNYMFQQMLGMGGTSIVCSCGVCRGYCKQRQAEAPQLQLWTYTHCRHHSCGTSSCYILEGHSISQGRNSLFRGMIPKQVCNSSLIS